MATIEFRMQAPGLKTPGPAESCAGCGRDFSKRKMMAAMKADNGERVGCSAGIAFSSGRGTERHRGRTRHDRI